MWAVYRALGIGTTLTMSMDLRKSLTIHLGQRYLSHDPVGARSKILTNTLTFGRPFTLALIIASRHGLCIRRRTPVAVALPNPWRR